MENDGQKPQETRLDHVPRGYIKPRTDLEPMERKPNVRFDLEQATRRLNKTEPDFNFCINLDFLPTTFCRCAPLEFGVFMMGIFMIVYASMDLLLMFMNDMLNLSTNQTIYTTFDPIEIGVIIFEFIGILSGFLVFLAVYERSYIIGYLACVMAAIRCGIGIGMSILIIMTHRSQPFLILAMVAAIPFYGALLIFSLAYAYRRQYKPETIV